MDKYLEERILTRNSDPLTWWEERKFAFPNLYKVMKSRLCVPATSVPSERMFSKTGQICNERRSRCQSRKNCIYKFKFTCFKIWNLNMNMSLHNIMLIFLLPFVDFAVLFCVKCKMLHSFFSYIPRNNFFCHILSLSIIFS